MAIDQDDDKLPITVIVPVRNAAHMIEDNLTAIFKGNPAEVIVVDGNSTDGTVKLAQKFSLKILSDEGQGLPKARMLGIEAARSEIVFLIDVDIVLPDGAMQALYAEFIGEKYDGLQAGLVSVSGDGYWGRALTTHHNQGLSKKWPGVMVTLFRRQVLLDYPFDTRFLSGEDIELRWRLRKADLKLGVSDRTVVKHRFDDTFEFAKDQFLADGEGLGRMISKYGFPAFKYLLLPLAGSVRGILLSIFKLQPGWIKYYLAYMIYNYQAMPAGIRENLRGAEETL